MNITLFLTGCLCALNYIYVHEQARPSNIKDYYNNPQYSIQVEFGGYVLSLILKLKWHARLMIAAAILQSIQI